MTPLATAISRALIHFVWQGSIVGLLLWTSLFALRRRSANLRYAASCAALAVLALMPIITTWTLYGRPIAIGSGTELLAPFSQVLSAVPSGYRPQQLLWLAWLQFWALPAWSIGVLLFSLRLIMGYKHAFLLGRRGNPASESVIGVVTRLGRAMRVHRPIRVLMSSITDTPSVVGWLRPVILLPAATLVGLTPLQLEAVLAHEMGHIKRYDYLVNMMQMLAETLLFYHPAVWWTSKRIRLERELCCDDLAVRFSGNALRYARALTTLEKLRLRAPGVAMASTGGPLLYRIQRLAGVTAKECGPSRLPAVLAISLGVLCFALNVSWIRGQDAPGVRVDLNNASVIHRTPVLYPEPASKQGITGTVQVEVKLDAAGNVADAHVLAGPEELRKAALESVLSWHFTSEAARSTRLINISFSDTGKQVQVTEPEQGKTLLTPDNAAVYLGESHVLADEIKMRIAKLADQFGREQETTVLTKRQQLEREMDSVKAEMGQAGQNDESNIARAQLAVKLQSLQRELESTPFEGNLRAFVITGPGGRGGRVETGPNVVSGRLLKAINTGNLSESVRNDLLSHLPVRVGDTLSPELIEQAASAVRAFDEHFKVGFVTTDDGQAELRIIGPGLDRR